MKALLIHPDRDLKLREKPSVGYRREDEPAKWTPQEEALMQDLQLEALLQAMARDDRLVLKVSRNVLLSAVRADVETVRYRQEILRDCIAHPDVISRMYAIAGEAMQVRQKLWHFGVFGRYAESVLHDSVSVIEALADLLRTLRNVAEQNSQRFQSRGITNLFATLRTELSDDYLAEVRDHLGRLRFRRGVPMSAGLGESNEGKDYVLHFREERRWEWVERFLGKGVPSLTVRIPDRDEAGARAYSELRETALGIVANALSQASNHVLSFFDVLQTELAFYIGCLNLHSRLAELGVPVTFPESLPAGGRKLRATGLCDVSLALAMGTRLVPNDILADGKGICVITGANQGGKSAFLRGIGLMQLMMQAGMFVAADSCSAEVCNGILTHFRREEDASMKSGKLDEELRRMSLIADGLSADTLVLFNEAFAATNEREGSEIARQVVTALLEKRVKMVFVTHLYDFPHCLALERAKEALFLRAERREDGTRTYKLVVGEPLETSFGQDVYRVVFDGGNGGGESTNERVARSSAGEVGAAPPVPAEPVG
jgi:DNA mismatch repair ATPase MutS